MKKISSDPTVTLTASYVNRSGENFETNSELQFTNQANYYDNTGIRKGIVLSRYVNVLQNWIAAVDRRQPESNTVEIYTENGIPIPYIIELSEWERPSTTLTVPAEFKDIFNQFNSYFTSEMQAIGDDTLQQESDVLDTLIHTTS